MEEPAKLETILDFTVPDGYRTGERLDVYLTGFIENATRAKVQKGIKEGRVTVNDQLVTKVSTPVQAGDRIQCRLLRPPPLEIVPEDLPVEIVYEDDDLMVVNKAAGMVVHPAYGHRSGTLVHALLYHLGGSKLVVEEGELTDDEEYGDDVPLSTRTAGPRYEGDITLRPGIVHRLDRDTSGLMVVAKNDVAHAKLAAQFMARTINRRYLALVWGVPEEEEGRIETFLGRDARDRKRVAVVSETKGKLAITHWKCLERFIHTSLLSFRLETGRTHQIRVHAAHMGHPVFGDPTYGGDRIRYGRADGKRKAFFRNLFDDLPRQALHAETIGFVHPTSGEQMNFRADPPMDMLDVIDRITRIDVG